MYYIILVKTFVITPEIIFSLFIYNKIWINRKTCKVIENKFCQLPMYDLWLMTMSHIVFDI